MKMLYDTVDAFHEIEGSYSYSLCSMECWWKPECIERRECQNKLEQEYLP